MEGGRGELDVEDVRALARNSSMVAGRTLAITALVFTLPLAGCRDADRPWPPGVQRVSEESPALPPDRAIQTLVVPPGFRVELIASEPMVEDPVAIDIDADGRIWVVEMRGYMPTPTARGEREPVGRIVVLDDTDDDGRSTSGRCSSTGSCCRAASRCSSTACSSPRRPNLWLARDTNGDLRADTKDRCARRLRPCATAIPSTAPTACCGGSTTGSTPPSTPARCGCAAGSGSTCRRCRAASGASRWTMSGASTGTGTTIPLCVDLLPAALLSRATRASCARAALYEPTTDGHVGVAGAPERRRQPRLSRRVRCAPTASLAIFSAAGTPVVYRGDRLPADLAATSSSRSPPATSCGASS